MHYLITGGAGFIGSNLIRRIFATEKEVFITCLDDFDPFYPEEFKQLNISGFKNNANFCLLNDDLSKISATGLAEKIGPPC
jgi:UDP-glucuronate 4-epimerase